MSAKRLRELIGETHKRGVNLAHEIKRLRLNKPTGWRVRVARKAALLKWLEALNRRRRRELAKKEPKAQRFTMYDAVTISNIPSNPTAVAGYVDGRFANFHQLLTRFPRAKHLSIAVSAAHDAMCLDVETGDATPVQAPEWVKRQHARGIKRPIVYANTSTMPAVLAALAKSGVKREGYMVWSAHYTGIPHIEPGSDATQWEEHDRAYDISLCESWFL